VCAARPARTRFAWSAFASRFARERASPTTACSSSRSAVSPAPAHASTPSIASRPFAYAAAWPARSTTPICTPSAAASSATNPAAPGTAGADVGVGGGGPGEGAGAEQRAADVGAAAARPRDDAARGPLEGGEPRRDDARLVQGLERAGVALDVELVARLAAEG